MPTLLEAAVLDVELVVLDGVVVLAVVGVVVEIVMVCPQAIAIHTRISRPPSSPAR
jgi:hypothetical protein